jgi:hypothetical protein
MDDPTFSRLFHEMVPAVRARTWELRADLPPHRTRLRALDACGRLCDWVEAQLPDSPADPRSGRMEALFDVIDKVAFGLRPASELLAEAREEVFASTVRAESWTELLGFRFPEDRLELRPGLTIEWLGDRRHAELLDSFRFKGSSDLEILPLRRGHGDFDHGWVVCDEWHTPRPFAEEAGEGRWDLAVATARRIFCVANLLFGGGWRSGASFYFVRDRRGRATMRNRPPWGSGDPHVDVSPADVTLLGRALAEVELDLAAFAPALHWYEAGLFQRENPRLRFVSWAMALEALALGGSTEPRISRRFVETIGRLGTPEKAAWGIWNLRSDLVHGRSVGADAALRAKTEEVRAPLRRLFRERIGA